jgi:hypothetical protein
MSDAPSPDLVVQSPAAAAQTAPSQTDVQQPAAAIEVAAVPDAAAAAADAGENAVDVSIFDDEISPSVAKMRYETIRVNACQAGRCDKPLQARYRNDVQGMFLQGQAVVRRGVCKRRMMRRLRADGTSEWPLWIQFLCALFLILLIIVVIRVICVIWQHFVTSR